MITKEIFETIIKEIVNFNKQVDNWCETLNSTLFESPLVQSGWKLCELLILTHFDSEGQDWINWWLYEKAGNSELKAWDEEGEEIATETIDDLWNIVKQYALLNY